MRCKGHATKHKKLVISNLQKQKVLFRPIIRHLSVQKMDTAFSFCFEEASIATSSAFFSEKTYKFWTLTCQDKAKQISLPKTQIQIITYDNRKHPHSR